MRGIALGIDTWRGRAALALVALALLLRLIIPAGYMPVAGKGYAITLCTGQGAMTAWIDADGKVHKSTKWPDQKPEHPCTFAGFATALHLPDLTGGVILPIAAATTPLASRIAEVAIGRGLAAPPPPPTGPPASL